MNETQRILFAAAHAGDTITTVNYNLCGLFLLIICVIIVLLTVFGIIQFILDFLYTILSSFKDKK